MNIESLRKNIKKYAGVRLVFNRSIGGYQVQSGFSSSDVEFPSLDSDGKWYLTESQCKTLLGYAYTLSEGNLI